MDKIKSEKVILTSLLVDLSDVVLNLLVAIFTHSSVMLAESLQGFADFITVGLLYIGIKRSERPATKEFSFGFGREVYFWSLFSAIIMFALTATLSFYFGMQRFRHPEQLDNIYLAYLILSVGIISNAYALSVSIRKLKQSSVGLFHSFFSSSLVEVKTAFISDLMGVSSAIVGGVALLFYLFTGDARYDGLGAMIIGVVIAIFAVLLINEAKNLIIGRSASKKIHQEIILAAENISHVNKVTGLKTGYIGSEKIQADLNINIVDGLRTEQIEKLIVDLETAIKEKVPEVENIQTEINSN